MSFIAQQSYKIDLTPQGGYVVVYVSQHDNSAREIVFKIYNQGQVFNIPANINVSVQGVKSNRGYFTHNCTYSGNLVTMPIADDMTDVIGKAVCVLKFTNASEEKLATAKFILNVDTDSSSEGIIIDTVAEEIFDQLMDEIRAQASAISADIAELQSMVGSPLVASTVSAMTDHNKIYVYTGSESGYTNGNWYYWDGSDWTSGGVYNAVAIETDDTLSVANMPADGKATGDAIAGLEDEISQIIPGLSSEAKEALLACFEHVAWIDEHGQDYYDALESALYPETGLVRIEATFTQGSAVIYEDSELNVLKAYLVVTGYYNNGVSKTETDYSLLGTLTVGTSTITASKEGKTATFDVTVSALPKIKLFVGKGVSGASLIDNAKRLLSEPIPFSNIEPITIQWEGISGYRYSIKNMISETVVDTTSTSYYPSQFDYGDDTDLAGNVYSGWIITDDLQTRGHSISVEDQTWEPDYFANTSGYLRFLIANVDALAYELPSTMPSGYITVQGTKYKIEVHEKNEFV